MVNGQQARYNITLFYRPRDAFRLFPKRVFVYSVPLVDPTGNTRGANDAVARERDTLGLRAAP